MNRTVVIGGVVAVAVLLGVAAWLLIGGKGPTSTSEQLAANETGPIALNPVEAVTDHTASESSDGRTLTITFPGFDLSAKSRDTASKVFSTTWRLKLAPEERALVAVAQISGYMKSAGAAAPAPAAESAPTAPAAPATSEATPAPAAEGAAPPPAEQPAKPAAPASAKSVAGDGVARVIVTFGSDTSVTEWTDATGNGADRQLSKATVLLGAGGTDVRNGGTVPVTVSLELSGGTSSETLARINAINLRLFAETAPVEQPAAAPTATETPAAPATTETAPAAPAPPADSGTTTPPADSSTTTPAPQTPTTPSP